MESKRNASNAYHDCINFENVNGKKIAQTKILSLRNPNRFREKPVRLMDLPRKPWRGTWVDSDSPWGFQLAPRRGCRVGKNSS